MISRSITATCSTFWMSTTGVAPETVIDSWMSPTVIWTSMLAVNPLVSSIPSRTNVVNPGSE